MRLFNIITISLLSCFIASCEKGATYWENLEPQQGESSATIHVIAEANAKVRINCFEATAIPTTNNLVQVMDMPFTFNMPIDTIEGATTFDLFGDRSHKHWLSSETVASGDVISLQFASHYSLDYQIPESVVCVANTPLIPTTEPSFVRSELTLEGQVDYGISIEVYSNDSLLLCGSEAQGFSYKHFLTKDQLLSVGNNRCLLPFVLPDRASLEIRIQNMTQDVYFFEYKNYIAQNETSTLEPTFQAEGESTYFKYKGVVGAKAHSTAMIQR